MNERIISLSCIDRIFLKTTSQCNVEMDALKELARILEIYALEILKNAIKVKNLTDRKTIKGKDIEVSYSIVKSKPVIW